MSKLKTGILTLCKSDYCDKTFIKQGTTRLYCENKCRDRWYLEKNRAGKIPPLTIEKICKNEYCNKTFIRKSYSQKFCTLKCQANDLDRRHYFGRHGKLPPVKCLMCDRGLDRTGRTANYRYCGPQCRNYAGQVARYGITPAGYRKMLRDCFYVCKICMKPLERLSPGDCNSSVKTVIDHCHKTGKVRGLLHSRCNVALGHFNDDSEMLQRAIEYLDLTGRIEQAL